MLSAEIFAFVLQFNSYSSVLMAGGILAFLISIGFANMEGDTVRWFSYTTILVAAWAIGYSFELSCTHLEEMLLCVRIEYLGVALLPATWIIFVIKFIEKEEWLTKKNYILIFSIPVLTLILNWTNKFHHLFYTSVSIDDSAPFPLLALTTGVWYKVHTAFFYSIILLSILLLSLKLKTGNKIFRIQTRLLLLGTIFPWIGNIIYLFGLRPYHHLDFTPYGFILTSFCFGLGLLKFRLFDIVPVAHETIIEKMQEGVLVLDEHERIAGINPAMEKIISECFNADEQKIIGLHVAKVFSKQDALCNTIAGQKNDKLELTLPSSSIQKYFSITITPLFKDVSKYKGTMLLFRETTERKKTEEKLRKQAEESKKLSDLKDKLFSIIAHDLRGPLSNLVSYFNLVEQGIISEEELKMSIPELNQNITKVALLTDNLLLWSRSQFNGEIIKSEDFVLCSSIDSIIHLYEDALLKKAIILKKDIPTDINVHADKDMLQVIIRNLLSNAVKFTKPGGNIMITAEQEDEDYITLSVKDDGIGLKKKAADNLFTQSLTTLGTQNEKGTGLGLKLTKEFIEKNGGIIWVESEENKGTTFYFTLPVSVKSKIKKEVLITADNNA